MNGYRITAYIFEPEVAHGLTVITMAATTNPTMETTVPTMKV
ncbi:hypothetical protein [Halogeometricum borinquense]|nr:hypothetical protein [Halogeometricum borinquense]